MGWLGLTIVTLLIAAPIAVRLRTGKWGRFETLSEVAADMGRNYTATKKRLDDHNNGIH